MNDTTTTETSEAPRGPNVRFNAERVKSSYCNVANAISSREEVAPNFGVNNSGVARRRRSKSSWSIASC
jgi:hypothetical protein